ncbi:Crp/Fnr family transcriptional regulator [Chitinophaga pendula]|uniref:Crp/Fnr family transcriptional regulator n=1 Tax=Chitinophaga TaxID=79328 RepID=UPI000BAEA84A|nr:MULTISPECIES: Crp/Fnr family transcriptional regulator [Chitinophaga]ASZ13309.1 cyclic nucleotide-binding protein [Chitinophaga sp. MD30]UCJ09066.1 Crp/Fnr family transcriptional regulator [Chitinophaga pendula]
MQAQEEKQLQIFITQLYPLPPAALSAFCSGWQPLTVKRKTVLTVAGETEKHLYFVVDGVQRAFYLGEDHKEATVVFTYPPSFSGIADSFLTQTPSAYFLETLTASRLLRINYDTITQLSQQYTSIRDMLLQTTAHVLKGVLARQVELQCYSNEEKFTTLLRRSPQLLQLVPHKYIASYLGIDATNFSKLYSSVKI